MMHTTSLRALDLSFKILRANLSCVDFFTQTLKKTINDTCPTKYFCLICLVWLTLCIDCDHVLGHVYT